MTDDTTALAEAVVEAGTNAPLLPMARLWLLLPEIRELAQYCVKQADDPSYHFGDCSYEGIYGDMATPLLAKLTDNALGARQS